MSGPLEGATNFLEGQGIHTLEYELDEVLSNIAFSGKADDLKYIYKKRRELKRKYDDFIASLRGAGGLYEESLILLALGCIRDAYLEFVYHIPSWKEMSPEQREEEAEEILGENLFLGSDSISLAIKINKLENEALKEGKKLMINRWSLWPGGDFELDYELKKF
ncbi:hypothetical protein ES703_11422 [subsurface metagenome]